MCDKKAFTTAELLIASALLIALSATALGGLVLLKPVFTKNMAQSTLQRDAAVLIEKIVDGKPDPGGIRLSESGSVLFYTNADKLTFTGTQDAVKRTYCLNDAGTKLLYSDDNGIQNKVVYAAPEGAVISLRFSPMNAGPTLCVSVYVGISQVVNGKTVAGTLQSSVFLRNHQMV
ncbi:MAG: hypothetical protein HQL28_04720 [Candidatus Omnitrophica bacterium]|nr:hypothetical protein [Candidatus Omnitrophota bacterium]